METRQSNGPSDTEIEQLRKALNDVTADFFAAYGEKFGFILVGPEGPRPPPKLELKILNLSSY